MDIRLMVVSHKDYWMPQDPMYLPIQVNAAGKSSFHSTWQRDDQGENISDKNSHFCELTALYWGWKNLQTEYIGLVHYRRYFACKRFGNKIKRIATQADVERRLKNKALILPTQRHYWVETNYTQYVHAHHEIDLLVTRRILEERYPAYLPAWESVMHRTSGHRFNLFVMKRALLHAYCEWLFDILFELEKRLDISDYDALDTRVFGLVSERLLDVWVETNQISYVEMPVVFLEKQYWGRKISSFLKRKWRGRKQ